MTVKVQNIDCGQGQVEVFIEVFVEAVYKSSQLESFPGTGDSGKQHDPSVRFEVLKSLAQLLCAVRGKDIVRVNVFWEG